MRTPSTLYSGFLNQNAKAPVYLVTFEGIPTRYATGPVLAPLGATALFMRAPSGAGQQITPDEGRSSISSLNFDLLDKDGLITRLLFLYQMANRLVTVKMGFLEVPEENWAVVFVGRVLTYTLARDNTFYKFACTDLQRDVKEEVFSAFTSTTAPVGIADVTINVGNTAPFAAATAGQFYIRINNEVIAYTGKTPTSFTGCTRGQLGTVAAAYPATDIIVNNFIVLQGNPLTLALQLLTSTGTGTNGPYDVLPASCGVGIPQAQVNVAIFEQERNRWTSGITFRFEESQKQNLKNFLQDQIYTFLPAYPVVDNVGRLSVKIAAPPLATDIGSKIQFTDDNITERPAFVGNVLDHYFFNELDLNYDFNFLTNDFDSRELFESPSSQALFGTTKTRTMESRGIRSSLMTAQRINNFGIRFLKRYAIPAPLLSAKGLLATRLIEVGDVIPLTSSKLPNLKTGTIGVIAQLVEVISAAPNYGEGSVQFELLNTPYSYGRRYAAISPSAKAPVFFPNYLGATPTQRNYSFISKKTGPQSGMMSNGDDGYYITP